MKSIPDVQVETRPSTGSSSGGGGGAKVWTITGQVRLRESEIDGHSHDRPLKGIEVKVSASDIGGDGPWTEWGTVRTDADGDFAVSETNNGKSRFFRVQARLFGVDLVVEDGTLADLGALDLADRNWRTIWKSGTQREGPAVSVGTRVFASGQSLELGDPIFRRQALIWYVLRTAIDHLEDEDPWFTMSPQTKALYPSNPFTHTSYVGESKLHLHEHPDEAWYPSFVLKEFMLMWHDLHSEGSRGWLGDPSADFAHGFSLFASNALLHELWGAGSSDVSTAEPSPPSLPSARSTKSRAPNPVWRTPCACFGAVSATVGGATCSAPPSPTRTIDPTTTATARWTSAVRRTPPSRRCRWRLDCLRSFDDHGDRVGERWLPSDRRGNVDHVMSRWRRGDDEAVVQGHRLRHSRLHAEEVVLREGEREHGVTVR
jgi:hypothetical protein